MLIRFFGDDQIGRIAGKLISAVRRVTSIGYTETKRLADASLNIPRSSASLEIGVLDCLSLRPLVDDGDRSRGATAGHGCRERYDGSRTAVAFDGRAGGEYLRSRDRRRARDLNRHGLRRMRRRNPR